MGLQPVIWLNIGLPWNWVNMIVKVKVKHNFFWFICIQCNRFLYLLRYSCYTANCPANTAIFNKTKIILSPTFTQYLNLRNAFAPTSVLFLQNVYKCESLQSTYCRNTYISWRIKIKHNNNLYFDVLQNIAIALKYKVVQIYLGV